MNKKIFYRKHFLAFVVIVMAFADERILSLYISILKNNNIQSFIVSLISGLFGFVIAVVPFAIQMLSNKESDFVKSLLEKDNLNFFIRPLFARLIIALKAMMLFFAFIITITIFQTSLSSFSFLDIHLFNIPIKRYFALAVFYCYLILGYNFLVSLRHVIRDLESLINTFFKSIKK